MKPVLVLFAHPALEQSRVNRRMRAAALDVKGVTFHDLYEEYPDFDVNVPREQRLLEAHDAVILQHPFYWYSTPALVKQWFDLVLEHGWAYGAGGDALQGKNLMSAITAGGSEAAYRKDGFHQATVLELLAPIQQTARLCQMKFLPPFVAYGCFKMSDAKMTQVASDYQESLRSLVATGMLPPRSSANGEH